MSSVRILSLALGLVLSVSSVACVAAQPSGQKNADGLAVPHAGSGEAAAASTGASTCDGACTHYLECMGIADTTDNRAACESKCVSLNATAADLAKFEQASCADIVAAANNTGSSSSSSSSGSTKSKECQGCVWDGSSCTWYSQSNWGSGPYSGAAAECNASCCQ